eukprot:2145115-Amphidinium_carterae.1
MGCSEKHPAFDLALASLSVYVIAIMQYGYLLIELNELFLFQQVVTLQVLPYKQNCLPETICVQSSTVKR